MMTEAGAPHRHSDAIVHTPHFTGISSQCRRPGVTAEPEPCPGRPGGGGARGGRGWIGARSVYKVRGLNPNYTYLALLVVQACHLLHHRLAKRHISYAEFVSAVVLCFPPFLISLPSALFVTAHLGMIAVQIVGSLWIRKLSPDWR